MRLPAGGSGERHLRPWLSHEEEQCRVFPGLCWRVLLLFTSTCQCSCVRSCAADITLNSQTCLPKAQISSSQKKIFFCRTLAGTSLPSPPHYSTEMHSLFLLYRSVSSGEAGAASCWCCLPQIEQLWSFNYLLGQNCPNFSKFKILLNSNGI